MRRSSVRFLAAALGIAVLLVFVGSLAWTVSAAPASKLPQQAPTFAQPTDQGANVTPNPSNATPTYAVPTVVVDNPSGGTPGKGSFAPPPTFDQVLAADPDAKAFLDSIKGLTADKIDLAQLYNIIVKIFKDQGPAAVSVFLHDSGLLDLLNIPQGYLDLLTVYNQSGMDGLIKAATDRKIINSHKELSGFVELDSKDNLATVTAALQPLGVSTYGYNDLANELEIGIPLDTLLQFQSPDTLLGYLLKIANTPHIIGFRVPRPDAQVAK
jgi:hypothetical protein